MYISFIWTLVCHGQLSGMSFFEDQKGEKRDNHFAGCIKFAVNESTH
jgi:hypothetical protein